MVLVSQWAGSIDNGFVAQIREGDSRDEFGLLTGCYEQAEAHVLPNDELVLL